MSLYLGKLGRGILKQTVANPRLKCLNRAANAFGKIARKITFGRYTPGLTREAFLLYQKTTPGDNIYIRNDRFIRNGEIIAENPYVSLAFKNRGINKIEITEECTPEYLANLTRKPVLPFIIPGLICLSAGMLWSYDGFIINPKSVLLGENNSFADLLSLKVLLSTMILGGIAFIHSRRKLKRWSCSLPSGRKILGEKPLQKNSKTMLLWVPPLNILEEIIFRFGFQYHLKDHIGIPGSILASSILHALAHEDYEKSVLSNNFIHGLTWGASYYLTGYCLLAPIVLHVASNLYVIFKATSGNESR